VILNRPRKYRIYPTPAQEAILRSWERTLRFLWNVCNRQRFDGLARGPRLKLEKGEGSQKIFVSLSDQQKQMTEMLTEAPDVAEVQCQARQKTLADLDMAWQRCFKKIGGRPHFKRHDDAMRIFAPVATVKYEVIGGLLSFLGPRYAPLGSLKIVLDRPLEGRVSSWSIKRELDEWYVVAQCAIIVDDPLPSTLPAVGIDRGVVLFSADSDGRTIEAPRFGEKAERRIARAQRQLAKKARGSKNRAKAVVRLAKIQRNVARRRKVFTNTESLYYAKANGTVVVEALRVKNMTASAAGTVDEPGSNVSAKAGLNRSILDAGWTQFRDQLKYKLAERGGSLVEVPPEYTSQTCAACGVVDASSRGSQSDFTCTACGHHENADVNAAKNVLARGLAQAVAPKKASQKLRQLRRKPKAAAASVKPTDAACGGYPDVIGSDETGTAAREDRHHVTG
jgi:putative transposase